MKPENPDEALLEQGLAAWDVPEPPPGLTDRILAQNAETLTALRTPPPPAEPPALEEDRPAMLPTDLRTERPMRPFWTATALGFAAAAAIVLAFMAGRQSNPPVVTPVSPSVEIQVSAPAPAASPQVPPEPPAPPAPATTIIIDETRSAVETIPEPPKVPRVRKSKDLRNPFDPKKDPPRSRKPGDVEEHSLKNPFRSEETPTGRTKASDIITTGGGDREAITATVKHRTSGLRGCYSKALRTQPELAGKTAFAIGVGLTGSVTSVVIEDDTLDDASVKACTKAKIEGWRFPMNGSTEGAEVSFSVVFSSP